MYLQNEEAEREMREMRERLRKLEEQEFARKREEQKRKLQKAAILSLVKINPDESIVSVNPSLCFITLDSCRFLTSCAHLRCECLRNGCRIHADWITPIISEFTFGFQ